MSRRSVRSLRPSSTRICLPQAKRASVPVGLPYATVGASLAAPALRQRLAIARSATGIRRPQRDRAAAIRLPGGTQPPADLPQLQPAGREHRCGVTVVVRQRGAKHRWAVPILRAEITASLGMSEPSAGSDLASLRTRAVLEDDHYVVNGQKVWTSGAHDADVLLTFVRTDPDAPKHKGISALLIPTETPASCAGPSRRSARPMTWTSTRCSSPTCGCRRRTWLGGEPGLAGGQRVAWS